jgi:hypothetical protein
MALPHLLCVLRLAGTGLARDQHGLILVVLKHISVGFVRDSELKRVECFKSSFLQLTRWGGISVLLLPMYIRATDSV